MNERVSAVFDNRNLAVAAIDELRRRGVDVSQVSLTTSEDGYNEENLAPGEILVSLESDQADAHFVQSILDRNAGRTLALA